MGFSCGTVQIFSEKLHKSKVSHAEFNTRCDWLLATASIDHTVKLWDLRNIKDKSSFLHELPHEKAVNSGKSGFVSFGKTLNSKLLIGSSLVYECVCNLVNFMHFVLP